jgi:hypothetical protein
MVYLFIIWDELAGVAECHIIPLPIAATGLARAGGGRLIA